MTHPLNRLAINKKDICFSNLYVKRQRVTHQGDWYFFYSASKGQLVFGVKSVGEVGCEYLATLHTARVCARYYYTLLVFEDVMASRLVTHEAAKRPQCFHLSLNSLFSHWNDIVEDIKYYKIITFVKYNNNYKAVFCRFLVIHLYLESLYVKEFFLSYSFIRNLSEKGYPRNSREKWVGPRLLHYFFVRIFLLCMYNFNLP